ncbi:hypothetical protein BDR03DRAFT_1019654 [Suillus americanus]|nr:hypothetical protein BDR03DRAFT_1019654 [Suillus americanus]
MDVASTADDEISLFCTWALTVTHVACDYTEEKFNAEKTGGDPVIPSPNLDTDLAYKNPIQMPIDIARYSKLISLKDTGHNKEREARLCQDWCSRGTGSEGLGLSSCTVPLTRVRALNFRMKSGWNPTKSEGLLEAGYSCRVLKDFRMSVGNFRRTIGKF